MIPAFPKPSQVKKQPVAVRVFRDGREVCNLKIKKGADEYQNRKKDMFLRQGRRCKLRIAPICKERDGRWPLDEMQFGHEVSRGGGKQDDRILVPVVQEDGTIQMKEQNGAVCAWCNSLQGSRPMSDFYEFVP